MLPREGVPAQAGHGVQVWNTLDMFPMFLSRYPLEQHGHGINNWKWRTIETKDDEDTQ